VPTTTQALGWMVGTLAPLKRRKLCPPYAEQPHSILMRGCGAAAKVSAATAQTSASKGVKHGCLWHERDAAGSQNRVGSEVAAE